MSFRITIFTSEEHAPTGFELVNIKSKVPPLILVLLRDIFLWVASPADMETRMVLLLSIESLIFAADKTPQPNLTNR